MQLTLDHLNGPGTSILNIFEKWDMLKFFDHRFGQTGLMVYEDEGYCFRIPFQIGEMNLAQAPKELGRNQVRLTHLTSKHSSVFLKNTLISLIESENGYKAVYAQEVGSGKARMLEENQAGKAYFILRDYPVGGTRFPNIDSQTGQSDAFKALQGAPVHLKVRVNHDWVQEITTIPFIVEYIDVIGSEITITGSNDTELTIKGFKGIRPQPDHGYIIFDIFDSTHGYSRSFYLMSHRGR